MAKRPRACAAALAWLAAQLCAALLQEEQLWSAEGMTSEAVAALTYEQRQALERRLDAAVAQSYAGRAADVIGPAPGGGRRPKVLYMVKTYDGYYETKLRALMDTWGSLVDKDAILLLGTKKTTAFDPPVFAVDEDKCIVGAGQGLACRVGYGMAEAARKMKKAKYDWVYIVDDDHYVVPHNVEKALAKYDPTEKIGLGCIGCGAGPPFHFCNGKGGFCGGCSYAFSKATVEALMENSEGIDFLKAHRQTYLNLNLTDAREDMTMSCLLDRLVPDNEKYFPGGLYAGLPNMAEVIMQGCRTDMLAQHSVSAKMFYKIHEQWYCNSTNHPDENVELEKYFQGEGANDTWGRSRVKEWQEARKGVQDALQEDSDIVQAMRRAGARAARAQGVASRGRALEVSTAPKAVETEAPVISEVANSGMDPFDPQNFGAILRRTKKARAEARRNARA